MSTREVVEEIARSKLIQECILIVTGGVWRSEYDDLVQDILIELLDQEKKKKIVSLFQKDQLRYYVMRIVRNNLQSSTSRFYYRYRRFSLRNSGPERLESYGEEKGSTN